MASGGQYSSGGGGVGLLGAGSNGTVGSYQAPNALGGGGGSCGAAGGTATVSGTGGNGGAYGGGGGAGTASGCGKGGGVGAGLAYGNNLTVTPGLSYTVVVGAAGAGTSGGGAGGVGAVRLIWPGCARSFPSTRTGDE